MADAPHRLAVSVAKTAAETGEAARRDPMQPDEAHGGVSLGTALRTPLFWVFAGATGLFSLVSSGFGLFNQAILTGMAFHTYRANRMTLTTTGPDATSVPPAFSL